jgi:5'-nucleotidase
MQNNNKTIPTILVTNDDGIHAKGLEALIEIVKPFGKVIVVAPEEGNSGMSHAITIKHPLRIRKHKRNDDVDFYSVNGTPVDCVKMAMNQVIKSTPNLLVSGINHGSNSSVSILYSGTMAAALEGCLYGIPSIGFSLLDYLPTANFEPTIVWGQEIVNIVVTNGLTKGTCLNVNFPVTENGQYNGIKVCRQNMGTWREEFEKRTDPRGQEYFWLTGYFLNEEPNATDTDEFALANGYVSVVPVSIDLTNYSEMKRISGLENISSPFQNELKNK